MRSGEANMFEERCAELERKIKHEAETAASEQKPNMTESSTLLEQAEGGVVAEVAAAHHLNEGAKAARAVLKQADGRLVADAEAAHHSNEDANAAVAEMEQAAGRFVGEAAATRNLAEDANAASVHNRVKMQTLQQQRIWVKTQMQQQHTIQVKMQTQQQRKKKQR